MFTRILIPVDLKHPDQMHKALKVAAVLAKQDSTEAHIVGVTQSSPTEVAKTPEAFSEKLSAFANEQSNALGFNFEIHTEISHDPAIDLDAVIMQTAVTIGADLIVAASHVPGIAEHVIASNAGYLAAHASMSVFVVR